MTTLLPKCQIVGLPKPSTGGTNGTSTRASSSGLKPTSLLGLPLRTSSSKQSLHRSSKPLFVGISAVLDKSEDEKRNLGGQKKRGSDGESAESLEGARSALERLYAQAQRYEERKLDPEFSAENELEVAVGEIERDLTLALRGLRQKEDELRDAEELLREDRRSLERARASLALKERQLEGVDRAQVGQLAEVEKLKNEVQKLSVELTKAQNLLAEREGKAKVAKEALGKSEEELRLARSMLLEKDEMLSQVNQQLRAKGNELAGYREREVSFLEQVHSLRSSVLSREEDLMSVRQEIQTKEGRIETTEKDLMARNSMLQAAELELGMLREEAMARGELESAEKLLQEVRSEIQAVKQASLKARLEVQAQNGKLKERESELSKLKSELATKEEELARVQGELVRVQEEADKSARLAARLAEQVAEGEVELGRLRALVEEGREKIKAQGEELRVLRREARGREREREDAELAIRVKEAEVVRYKLEAQGFRAEFGAAKRQIADLEEEMAYAHTKVRSLHAELSSVTSQLREKELQLASLSASLLEKDKIMQGLRSELDMTHSRLTEAGGVVKRIAELSSQLASAASGGAPVDENQVLTQTNYELFSANRTLLERERELHHLQEMESKHQSERELIVRELEGLRGALRDREAELAAVTVDLETRDRELQRLISRWQVREAELSDLRGEVIGEAERLASQAATNGDSEDQAGVQQLEIEVAKLEVETALCALRGLADLSEDLKEECRLQPAVPVKSAVVPPETKDLTKELSLLSKLKEQLVEKDSALLMAKSAMDNLSKLTQKLLVEAGVGAEDDLSNTMSLRAIF